MCTILCGSNETEHASRNRIIASLCIVLLFAGHSLAADEKKPASAAPATQHAHADTPAWRAFARFKALGGQRWEGKSAKGWTEQAQRDAGVEVVNSVETVS